MCEKSSRKLLISQILSYFCTHEVHWQVLFCVFFPNVITLIDGGGLLNYFVHIYYIVNMNLIDFITFLGCRFNT